MQVCQDAINTLPMLGLLLWGRALDFHCAVYTRLLKNLLALRNKFFIIST
jgi:hypothetical protein